MSKPTKSDFLWSAICLFLLILLAFVGYDWHCRGGLQKHEEYMKCIEACKDACVEHGKAKP